MTWKQIEGYEDYEVSDTGLVRSLRFGKKKILRAGKLRNGYLIVMLVKGGKRKNMRVHRLVADAFIPNPLGLETVNHRDENKLNNIVANLEWMSRGDNCRYSNDKSVLQLGRQGNVVNRFPSAQEASRQTGIVRSSISEACGGIRKTAGGYFWKFA